MSIDRDRAEPFTRTVGLSVATRKLRRHSAIRNLREASFCGGILTVPLIKAALKFKLRHYLKQAGDMRIPIRNKSNRPLSIFVELQCDQFEVPVGGDAIVRLEDGRPHSIDIDDGFVTVWDEGANVSVEVISKSDKRVDEALMLARIWLHRLGAKQEALLLDVTVDRLELSVGYFASRDQVFRAFHNGFSNENIASLNAPLAACHRAGKTAARLNEVARENGSFPELSAAPFDTDIVRAAFCRALSNVG